MGRPIKRHSDWFPHPANAARQSGIIEVLEAIEGTNGEKLRNNGYAFWFKLLEQLAGTDGMYIDCSRPDQWLRLISRVGISEEDVHRCIDALVTLDAIDRGYWETRRILYCPDLARSVQAVRPRRGLAFGPPPPEEKRAAGSVDADVRHVITEETSFGPVEIDTDWARVEDSYARQIGALPMGKALDQLMELYDALGADIVILAIEYANKKQVDNPKRYLIQILRNWLDQGITTVAAAQAQINEHERRGKRGQPAEPPEAAGPVEDSQDVRWID